MIPTGGFLKYTGKTTDNFFDSFTQFEFAEKTVKDGLKHGSLMGKTSLHQYFLTSNHEKL